MELEGAAVGEMEMVRWKIHLKFDGGTTSLSREDDGIIDHPQGEKMFLTIGWCQTCVIP